MAGSIVKQVVGNKTAIGTISQLPTNTYQLFPTTQNNTTNRPVDNVIEISFTSASGSSPTGYVAIFAQASYDGTTWQTGPSSSYVATDEGVLTLIGAIPVASSSVAYVKAFSVASAFGGVLPSWVRFIARNVTGVTIPSIVGSIAEVNVLVE